MRNYPDVAIIAERKKIKTKMESFWNKRYELEEYVYGENPNVFFREVLDKITPGKILLPADGEGRNSVYAASKGWEVDAFDYSRIACEKALRLAAKVDVKINYAQGDILNIKLKDAYYDVLGIFFLHLPSSIRREMHQKLLKSLKPQGLLIMEVFSKDQLGKQSGGPQEEDFLYSLDQLKEDFKMFSFNTFEEISVYLDEGSFHRGMASTIRVAGVKSQ